MRKKFYVGAFAMAMASLVAIGASSVEADAAAADAIVTYHCDDQNGYTETLEVSDGSAEEGGGVPYMFYTTTNVTTTIPANSKWTKIPAGEELDVSSYNGKTVFFFAQSPNPDSVDDILKVVLPAKPALTGLAYKAGATATGGNIDAAMFSLDKAKVDKKGFSLTGLTTDEDIEKAMPALKVAKDALGSQQSAKTYSVVYYNNQDGTVKFGGAAVPADTTGKVKEYCARYEIGKSDTSAEGNGKWLRPSVPFTLKVAKPAAAPNITFNYANHTMALKNGMQYVSAANFEDVEMGKGLWTDPVDEGAESPIKKIDAAKGVNEPLAAGQKYAVVTVTKNASSIPTYIDVPAIVPFMGEGGAGGAVSVEGTLVENDKDKVILHLGAAGAGSMTYQYKIVDGDVTDFIADGHFDYAGDDGLKWTNVAVTNTKDVTIAGKSLKGGKKILVRVMKGKTSFSSDVVILCQPENPGEGWELYEPGADAPIKNATRGEAVYNPKDYTITIPFTGIKKQPELGEGEAYPSIKLTAGKKSFTVPDGKATWNSDDEALVINMSADEEFKKLDGSTAVTVDIPAGWLIDSMDNVLPAQKITGVNVDNVAPKITSVAMAKDKAGNAILTVTIDSPVKVKQDGEDDVVAGAEVGIEVDKVVTVTPMATIGDTPAAATDKDDLAIVDSATLKLSGKNSIITLTLANMPTIADMIAGYKVELLGDTVTDLVGNEFATGTNSAIAQNKVAYNKDAVAAVLDVKVSDISGGKVTVTVTSNETLDVKSLTALKNAITVAEGYKVSGVTWIKQNTSFTFTISGLSASTTGTLATINATADDGRNIKDARGFELAATKVEIKASSTGGGDESEEGGDES